MTKRFICDDTSIIDEKFTCKIISGINNKIIILYFFGRIGLALLFIGIALCGYLTAIWLMGSKIGDRPLLLLGVLCIILGVQSISTGFIGDMIVDATYRQRYEESYIKEII